MSEKPRGEESKFQTEGNEQKERETTLNEKLADVSKVAKAKLDQIREEVEKKYPGVFEKPESWKPSEQVMAGVREAALRGETHYDFVLESPYDYIYDDPASLEKDQQHYRTLGEYEKEQ